MTRSIAAPAARPPVRSGNVHVTGRRVGATVVDGLFLAGAYAVMAAFFGTLTYHGEAYWTAMMPAGANMAYGVLVVAYYLLLESYWGQTLGKMLAAIRVADELTGDRPMFRAVAIRTALRPVDGLAGYLVAFVTVLLTSRRQRLGDLAAHTVVAASP